MATRDRYWTDGQIKNFVFDLRRSVGSDAWRWMVRDVKVALVSQRALDIVIGLVRPTVDVNAIRDLLARMLAEAGLEER